MELSDDDLEQIAGADRREVDPPIQVDTATWSTGGQLDWWVKDRQEWFGRVRGADGRQRGLELVIFVPRAAHSHDGFTEGARVGGASNQRTSPGRGCCDA
jgi:hypothetical protein